MSRALLYALVLSALVLVPRAIWVQWSHGPSSDDDYHLVRGLEFLQGDRGLVHRELNDPPLGEAFGAVPLWAMGGTTHGKDEGTALFAQSYSPDAALMAVAIWKTLLFLPVIGVVFAWSRRLYGPGAAWLAVGLLLIEPTIAGHVHLASLDVIGTGGIVIACYCGWRYFEAPSTARLILAAAMCALALLLKHTAVLVPAILCGYAVIYRGRQHLPALVKAGLLTLLFMWALLGFDMSPVRGASVPGGIYVKSVLDARDHVAAPNDAYLWGQTRRGGWWYYFPAVATYKVPVGIALVVVMGLASIAKRGVKREEWSLLLPALGYTVFLMLQNINIGWRHFLPAYVFILMLATRVMLAGKVWRIAACAAVVLTAIDLLRWGPDDVAYVNWPRRDIYLSINDSNIDWGQGLKQARRWLEENKSSIGGRPVYFRASAVSNRAVRYYLPGVTQLHPGDEPPRQGVLIVSPVSLSGLSESADEYGFLRGVKPEAVIGHALRVYDLDKPRR
jgi:hypothetical protein